MSKFDSIIDIRQFFKELNKKIDVWYDMTKHFDRKLSFDNNNNNRKSNSSININKQDSKDDRVDDRIDEYYIYQSTNEQFRFDNSSYQNRTYQNNQQSNDRSSQRVLSFEKQWFQIIDENASDSRKDQKSSRNVERFADNNRQDDNNNARQKNRIYVVDEDDENEIIDESYAKDFHDDQNVFYSQNLIYYDSNNEFDDLENDTVAAHFVVFTSTIKCRRCHKTFDFNNQLHTHLRIDCQTLRKTFTAFVVEVSFTAVIKTISMSIEIELTSTDVLSKISNFNFFKESKSIDSKTSIISSNVNVFKDFDIDFEFRNWSYVKDNVSLIENEKKSDVCFDTDVNVILIDVAFFKKQNFDVSIRQMTTSFTMRDLDISQHQNLDYAILSMYFDDVKNDNFVKALIRREVHLVDNLKINMLIENDVIVSEDVVFDLVKKQALIDNCEVTIAFDVRSRVSHAQQRSIHVKKVIVLSSRNQMIISIHHLVDELLVSRDFLFEFDDSNLILYAHIIDVDIKIVLIINDSNTTVKISRNFRLDKLIELDFSQTYHLNESENVVELTKRRSKFEHKTFWFKKIITVVVVAIVVVITVANIVSSKISIDIQTIDNVNSVVEFNAVVYSAISSIFELTKSFAIEIESIDSDEKSFANSSFEIVMFNEVTIHQFEVTSSLVNIIDEFSVLWKNIVFVELSQKN